MFETCSQTLTAPMTSLGSISKRSRCSHTRASSQLALQNLTAMATMHSGSADVRVPGTQPVDCWGLLQYATAYRSRWPRQVRTEVRARTPALRRCPYSSASSSWSLPPVLISACRVCSRVCRAMVAECTTFAYVQAVRRWLQSILHLRMAGCQGARRSSISLAM